MFTYKNSSRWLSKTIKGGRGTRKIPFALEVRSQLAGLPLYTATLAGDDLHHFTATSMHEVGNIQYDVEYDLIHFLGVVFDKKRLYIPEHKKKSATRLLNKLARDHPAEAENIHSTQVIEIGKKSLDRKMKLEEISRLKGNNT